MLRAKIIIRRIHDNDRIDDDDDERRKNDETKNQHVRQCLVFGRNWYDVYWPNIINPWGCIEPVIIPSSPFPFDLLMRRACSVFFKAIRIQEVFIDIQTKRLITWTMKEKTVRLLKKSCREMASIMPYLLPMIPAQLISCLAHQEPN